MIAIQAFLIINLLNCIYGGEFDDLKKQLELMQKNFERNLSQINDELLKIKNENSHGSVSCGNDWLSYLDTKCFKVLEKKGTELEAKWNCSEIDSSLITIESKEEQLFLANILEKYNNISDNVWIGLEMSENKSYKWLGETEIKYENWGENSNKIENCVEMSLGKSSLGKWTDDLCTKKYLIICQKKQNTITVLQEELKKQQVQINSLIPIGFLYTQLPNESSPQVLWPKMKWIEVTKNYTGLFFRAEGGESLPFGQIQQESQSSISQVYYYGCEAVPHGGCADKTTSLIRNTMTNVSIKGFLYTLQFYTTGVETRPKNTAIRIFKRIQ